MDDKNSEALSCLLFNENAIIIEKLGKSCYLGNGKYYLVYSRKLWQEI